MLAFNSVIVPSVGQQEAVKFLSIHRRTIEGKSKSNLDVDTLFLTSCSMNGVFYNGVFNNSIIFCYSMTINIYTYTLTTKYKRPN